MKKLLMGLVMSLFILLPATPAAAHVLVTDESHTKGAIIHIMPDDDPIAGQQSTLYFDTQSNFTSNDSVSLTITDAAGNKRAVTASTEGSLATASYTFPVQGVYDLQFVVKLGDKSYVYNQSQRVSRGTSTSALDAPNYDWAEMLLIASMLGFAVLSILVFNNHRDIVKHSKFK